MTPYPVKHSCLDDHVFSREKVTFSAFYRYTLQEMFALLKYSKMRGPVSGDEGQDMVFYLPKGKSSEQISVIENRLRARIVLIRREKVVCHKCFVKVFHEFEEKRGLTISEPLSIEKRSDPVTQLERMRLFKTIKRLGHQLLEQSARMARLTARQGECQQTGTSPCMVQGLEGASDAPRLFSTVIDEMRSLSCINKHNRRFSERLLDIAQLLYSLSPRCYRVLRQIFILPTQSTLYCHYGPRVREIQECLTDVSKIDGAIAEIAASMKEENEKIFTLAVDAFAFRSFSGQTLPSVCIEPDPADSSTSIPEEDQTLSNGFMFLIIPLSTNYKAKLIHIATRRSGNYDGSIDEIVSLIKEMMVKHGLKLFFKATDGDRFLTKEHARFFDDFICSMPPGCPFWLITDRIYELLQSTSMTMPIADPLHFSKNARSRLLKHPIVLQHCQDNRHTTNLEQIRHVLGLGKALEDRSPLGAMRDAYVTELFHLRNVAELLKHGCVADAFLLLPYSAIFAAIFEPTLRNDSRLFFIEVAYRCYWHFLTESPKILESPHVHAKFRTGVSQATTIAEEPYIVRMIHTSIALAIALRHGPRFVRMDALGTHLVENRIGNARAGCNDPRWSRILSNCSLAEVRRELAKKHGFVMNVSKRVNDGGAKVDTCSSNGLELPEGWQPNLIVQFFVDSLKGDGCVSGDLLRFANDLAEIAKDITKPAPGSPSDVANSAIMARNISFGSALWRTLTKIQKFAILEDEAPDVNIDDESEEDVRDESP